MYVWNHDHCDVDCFLGLEIDKKVNSFQISIARFVHNFASGPVVLRAYGQKRYVQHQTTKTSFD